MLRDGRVEVGRRPFIVSPLAMAPGMKLGRAVSIGTVTAVLLASLFLTTSCTRAPTYQPVRDQAEIVAELAEQIAAAEHTVQTLKGVGRVTFEQRGRSNSSSFTLRYRAPDRLRIDLFGPLGIPTLLVAITGDEAAVALPEARVQWIVDLAQTSIPMAKEIAWAVVRDALLGGAHMPPPELFGETELGESDGTYMMRWQEGRHQYAASIDKSTRTLTRLEVFDADGRLEQRYRYRRYREVGGFMRPSVIALDVPREGASVVVTYDSLRMNLDIGEEELELPAGLERQELPPEFEGPGLGEELFEGQDLYEPE